jgi:hypothetical protein
MGYLAGGGPRNLHKAAGTKSAVMPIEAKEKPQLTVRMLS